MPIARQGASSRGGGGSIISPPFLANVLIPQGALVSVTFAGGNTEIELADNTTNGERVLGFAVEEIAIGQSGKFVVGRGSIVTPIQAGGVAFTPNDGVFLATSGEVSQTPPQVGSTTIFQIGFATSTTEILLTTDFKKIIP